MLRMKRTLFTSAAEWVVMCRTRLYESVASKAHTVHVGCVTVRKRTGWQFGLEGTGRQATLSQSVAHPTPQCTGAAILHINRQQAAVNSNNTVPVSDAPANHRMSPSRSTSSLVTWGSGLPSRSMEDRKAPGIWCRPADASVLPACGTHLGS